MRFTVTPLGGGRADTARVVDSIVRYLQPPPKTPAPTPRTGDGHGPERYYADHGEEPGRWIGRAAREAGLVGSVQRQDLASVLAGRDPHTGERLITAQGSAGRRPTLGSGNHTKLGPDGERLYGAADAATVLGVSQAEVERMLDIGTAVAFGSLATPSRSGRQPGPPATPPARQPVGAEHPVRPPVAPPARQPAGAEHPVRPPATPPARHPAGADRPLGPPATPPAGGLATPFRQPAASYLVPSVEPDGTRWVCAAELDRCAQARGAWAKSWRNPGARQRGRPSQRGRGGAPQRSHGAVSTPTRQTPRRQHRAHPDSLDAGRQPRRAYLVAPEASRVGGSSGVNISPSSWNGDARTRSAVLSSIQNGNDWALGWL